MKCTLILLLTLISDSSIGQDFIYLEDIHLRKKADFIENKNEVIKAVDFLMSTNINESEFDRKACTRFILRYAEKTPFITLTIDQSVSKVYQDNPGLLQMYEGLWLKSALNNEGESDSFHEEYVYSELSKYCANENGIIRTSIIESLIVAGQEGSIDQWIKELKS